MKEVTVTQKQYDLIKSHTEQGIWNAYARFPYHKVRLDEGYYPISEMQQHDVLAVFYSDTKVQIKESKTFKKGGTRQAQIWTDAQGVEWVETIDYFSYVKSVAKRNDNEARFQIIKEWIES